MSAGMMAMLMGIAAGFLTLIGLYIWLAGNDATTGIVLFAIAGAQMALIPAATRGRGDSKRCSKG